MPAATATYLYCLVRRASRPSLARVPPALPGLGPVRLVDAGEDIWLIASDAPGARWQGDAIERRLRDEGWVAACALAHEAVVESFLRQGAVVPMKLFTLFLDDARAVAHVARIRKRVSRIFDRVEGCEEWGVRLALDERRAARASRVAARRATRGVGTGRAFLLRKKGEADAARLLRDVARDEADRMFHALAKSAKAAQRRTPPAGPEGASVLLDAAFLVQAKRSSRFARAVRGQATRLGTKGFDIVLTGPWPAYHFAMGSS